MNPLPREFYRRDPRLVAPELLNKVLVRGGGSPAGRRAGGRRAGGRRAGRIVEVEAYCGGEDPASHAFRGPTARNRTMFGPPGHLYVYFTYGMHWCCNPVCGDEGVGVAVLLRALAPLEGVEQMRAARGAAVRRDRDLANGPAKLCEALGLSGEDDGADLVTGDRSVWIEDDGTAPPVRPAQGVRVGITRGAEHPWRWWVDGDPHVSRARMPGDQLAKPR